MANSQVQSANLSITDLPVEMMEKIFEYLTFQEHLLISATCKSWRKLVFCPQFCKRLYIHLRTADDLEAKHHARKMFGRCNLVISFNSFVKHHVKQPSGRGKAVISFNSIQKNQALLKDYLEDASLESLEIVAKQHTGKCIVKTALQTVESLKTLIVKLPYELPKGEHEIIEISHPNLKHAILEGNWNYAVKCPNMTSLVTYDFEEKSVRGLQEQLRSLTLIGDLFPLWNGQWEHLQELCLYSSPHEENLGRMLECMPCLEKLSLLNIWMKMDREDAIFTGMGLEAAKCLKELTLTNHRLNTVLLNKFLSRSTLHSITLQSCLISTPEREVPLKSSSIKRMTYVKCDPRELLPLFTKLESFDLQCSEAHLDNTLKQICEYYPALERLSIGVKSGQIGQYEATTEPSKATPFSHLKNLEKLKVLQINRIDLSSIDWGICTNSKVEWLRLEGCSISGVAAALLVKSFKHLRTLFLDHCYLRQPRTNVFDIDENCSDGLRSSVPHCIVSYYDCHIEAMFDRCGRSGAVI